MTLHFRTNMKPEVVFSGRDRHLEKWIWRHISEMGAPIWTKFGSLVQNTMQITAKWSRSKQEVEFQYAGRLCIELSWRCFGWSFLFVFDSNYGRICSRLWDISVKGWRDLKNQIRGRSRSLKMAPFDRPYVTFYWSTIVSIALFCAIFSLFDVE